MNRSVLGWLLVALQALLLLGLILLPWRTPTVVSLIVGAIMVVAGLLAGIAATLRLGSALTTTPVPLTSATLRTTGIYQLIRHPIYSALLLVIAGLVIAAGSWWSCLWGLGIGCFFYGKSRWEDAMLRSVYDQQWLEWAATTGAFIPRLRRRLR